MYAFKFLFRSIIFFKFVFAVLTKKITKKGKVNIKMLKKNCEIMKLECINLFKIYLANYRRKKHFDSMYNSLKAIAFLCSLNFKSTN